MRKGDGMVRFAAFGEVAAAANVFDDGEVKGCNAARGEGRGLPRFASGTGPLDNDGPVANPEEKGGAVPPPAGPPRNGVRAEGFAGGGAGGVGPVVPGTPPPIVPNDELDEEAGFSDKSFKSGGGGGGGSSGDSSLGGERVPRTGGFTGETTACCTTLFENIAKF